MVEHLAEKLAFAKADSMAFELVDVMVALWVDGMGRPVAAWWAEKLVELMGHCAAVSTAARKGFLKVATLVDVKVETMDHQMVEVMAVLTAGRLVERMERNRAALSADWLAEETVVMKVGRGVDQMVDGKVALMVKKLAALMGMLPAALMVDMMA